MFTTIDKALAALITPAVSLGVLLGFDFGLSAETIGTIASVLTGALVWLIPNKT